MSHYENYIDKVIASPYNHETIYKLAVEYSDGIIINSEKVNNNIIDFAKGKSIPVLDYQTEETYNDAVNNFYDTVWSNNKD